MKFKIVTSFFVIKIIKNKRNDLAHGSISFEQCGQNIPLFSMQENYRHASNALLALFNGINSYLVDSLRLFRDNNVYKYFGLSWADMKKLTHEEFVFIMDLSAEKTNEDQKKLANTLNSINETK